MIKCWDEDCQYFREHGECSEVCTNQGISKIITNFDMCCKSVENMAQIIDIAKIGWTKEQIIEWLNKPIDN